VSLPLFVRHVASGHIEPLRQRLAGSIVPPPVPLYLRDPEGVVCLAIPEREGRIDARGHAGWVDQVVLDPGDRNLLTLGQDQTAKLWDAHAGREIGTYAGDGYALTGAAFSPDRSTLLVVSVAPVGVLDGTDVKPRFAIDGDRLVAQYSPDGLHPGGCAGEAIREPRQRGQCARRADRSQERGNRRAGRGSHRRGHHPRCGDTAADRMRNLRAQLRSLMGPRLTPELEGVPL
jgi:hypothetical protein